MESDEIKENNFSEMLFNRDEQLLDYITNLQQELKEANESITWWQNRFKALEKENERLKDELEFYKQECDDLEMQIGENNEQ